MAVPMKHRMDQPGWNDLRPDVHRMAKLSRKYIIPVVEVRRLIRMFWNDQRGKA